MRALGIYKESSMYTITEFIQIIVEGIIDICLECGRSVVEDQRA
jgi:hypothetical protein